MKRSLPARDRKEDGMSTFMGKKLKLDLKAIAELYDHRITLYIALCSQCAARQSAPVWRSKAHSDGSIFDGWFILGIGSRQGRQITYHLPVEYWDECAFAATLDRAPEWDGHTPQDVLSRLKDLCKLQPSTAEIADSLLATKTIPDGWRWFRKGGGRLFEGRNSAGLVMAYLDAFAFDPTDLVLRQDGDFESAVQRGTAIRFRFTDADIERGTVAA